MATCPFCRAELADANVTKGECPACGKPFAAGPDSPSENAFLSAALDGEDSAYEGSAESASVLPLGAPDIVPVPLEVEAPPEHLMRAEELWEGQAPQGGEEPRSATVGEFSASQLEKDLLGDKRSVGTGDAIQGSSPALPPASTHDGAAGSEVKRLWDTEGGLAEGSSSGSEFSASQLNKDLWEGSEQGGTMASQSVGLFSRDGLTPLPGQGKLTETVDGPTIQSVIEEDLGFLRSSVGADKSAGTDSPKSAPTERAGEPEPSGISSVSRRHSMGAAERMRALWSGRFQSNATPRTSIKTDVRLIEQEAKLVIQPRAVHDGSQAAVAGADYELIERLGEGGMGIVFLARQASLDRTVALKRLKRHDDDKTSFRDKFLAEAIVTGELEHPNIVPIYDVGVDHAGTLFYSMKRVKGTPWDSVLRKKTLPENLEILMKVADAVAFAHSKNVVHRDIKPENVMLGDYGEVVLMDWGLAVMLGRHEVADLGGTPAYMAPEMAAGPVERIGLHSDVYLLGATLFDILAGQPPHSGKNVMQCLFAAARNEIQATEVSSELLDIARHAMATNPEDRFAHVVDFKNAIRDYQSHSESVMLSARADEFLAQGKAKNDYEAFSRAIFGFQEALRLWPGNSRAEVGAEEATVAYARCALSKGDFDLGLSLLDPAKATHADLRELLRVAQSEREARKHRLKLAKRIGVALAAVLFLVVTGAYVLIRAEAERARLAEGKAIDEKQEADRQRTNADKQREIAEQQAELARRNEDKANKNAAEALAQKTEADRQRSIAVENAGLAKRNEEKANKSAAEALTQKTEADRQRANAESQTKIANDQRLKAEAARRQEEYEAYVARIGLAAARIEENAFDSAISLLEQCPAERRDWEWGRLMFLCTQDLRQYDAGQPIDALAVSPDGKRFVTGGWGGEANLWDAETGKSLLSISTPGKYIFALAFSPDGSQIAIGGNAKPDFAAIYDATTGKLVRGLRGHRDAVLSAAFSRDGKRLLTGSYDGSARLWDLESGQSRAFVGHDWWVWNAAFSPDERRIVTASQDGSAMVWSVETGRAGAPFLGHNGPVYAASFTPDGRRVATAGYDKRILLWDPAAVKSFDFEAMAAGRPQSASVAVDVLAGHSAAVRSIRFSKDGKLLLSGGNDNTVRLWDVASHKLIKTLRGHAGQVSACTFSKDGQKALSAGYDHLVKLWDIAGYQEARVLQGKLLHGHRDAILGAAFSPNGQQVVTASRDRTARLWNVATGSEIREFREGHDFLASRAVFFPDGRRLLTAAVDNTTRIWDVAGGTQLAVLTGTGPSAIATLSNDGAKAFTGSDDQTVKIWDAKAGKLLSRLSGHRGEVTAIAVSRDDALLLTGDSQGRIRLWDAKTNAMRWEAREHSRGVSDASFLSDGKRVLTASLDNTVGQWDIASGKEVASLRLKHPDAVTSMAVSPDGQFALTTCADRVARLWDVEKAGLVREFRVEGQMLNAAAFAPNGQSVLATASDNTVRRWDVASGREMTGGSGGPLVDFRGGGGMAWSAAFSPDGSYVVVVGGADARSFDVKTGRENVRYSPPASVASAQFSPDGTRVVAGGWDNTARVWDIATGRDVLKLDGVHSQFVNSAEFSSQGDRIVTASDDGTVVIWNAKTGKPIHVLRGHEGPVTGASFSLDGKRVLSASQDKTARLWDAATGKEAIALRGHSQGVLCAAFSRDGLRVATGSEDNTARLWDAQTGRETAVRLQGHTASVNSVAFSADGTRVVTGSEDNTAKIWDAATGKEFLTLRGHANEVTSVAFSPDGRNVLTGSRDGSAIVWFTADWRKGAASNDVSWTKKP